MLPKTRRINKAIFPTIIRDSLLFSSPTLSLRLAKRENSKQSSLLAVVVSVKIAKLAVRRNLIKRRYHAVLSKNLNLISNGYFLIFYVNRNTSQLPIVKIEDELLSLMAKAKILKNA